MDYTITYKVAPRGEGKTKWLLEKAHSELLNGNTVYYFSNDKQSYDSFMSKCARNYGMVCHIEFSNDVNNIPMDTVVLVDDLSMRGENILEHIYFLRNTKHKLYVTIEGYLDNN